MPASPTPTLPSRSELELADYKIGSFLSDLDSMLSAVKGLSPNSITVEEYLRLTEAGEELPATPPLDEAELARIVVFATEVLGDAERIAELAQALQREAAALHREANADLRPAQRERIAAWHRECLDRTGARTS